MSTHPVRLSVAPPGAIASGAFSGPVASSRRARIHVLIRLALLAAVGTLGCSSVYWMLYIALPAIVALFIATKGGPRYLSEDAPAIVGILRWFAAAYGYLWLLTDAFPPGEGARDVELQVETGGSPSAASALLRLVSSLPALALLAVMSIAAGLVWVGGAVAILVSEQVPPALTDFLAMTLRYQFRLLAYHLSLVDRYPALDAPARQLPRSDAA
jgi:hypothetical protein